MADVPGDGRGFALVIGLMWLLFVIFMLGGLLFLCTQVGNDLIMEARRLYCRLRPDISPAPVFFEACRALRDLCNIPA
jgi:hypothetical protein